MTTHPRIHGGYPTYEVAFYDILCLNSMHTEIIRDTAKTHPQHRTKLHTCGGYPESAAIGVTMQSLSPRMWGPRFDKGTYVSSDFIPVYTGVILL